MTDKFNFWRAYYDALRALPTDAMRGRFMLALCAWAFDDVEPDFSDEPMLEFGWRIARDQVAESVRLSKAKSEGGREGGIKSGETRRKRSKRSSASSTPSSSGSSTARSERKRTERNGTVSVPETGASLARACEARSLAPDDDDDARWRGDTL